MSKCKGCGAEIKWIRTENNKNMPLDLELITIYIVDVAGFPRLAKGHQIHWATCPEAKQFKKKGK